MIDSMDGKDAVKLSYMLETVSRQTPIQLTNAFALALSLEVARPFVICCETQEFTADTSADQKLIESLETLVQHPESLHPFKVSIGDLRNVCV